MMTTTDVADIPTQTRPEAISWAATEYERLVDVLRSLDADDWAKPTDCPLWDVRAMAAHNVGMMSDFTSLRSVIRRMRAAEKRAKVAGGPTIDSMTALQVEDHASLTVAELVAKAEVMGPKSAKWRTTGKALLRKVRIKEELEGEPETWTIGYLLDVILTRDAWMHRVDISRATNHEMVLTADHDGRLIADVLAEWARRHGQPFTLELTGPVGGTFVKGSGGEHITIDAVEFCRILSGRATGAGLLSQPVPF